MRLECSQGRLRTTCVAPHPTSSTVPHTGTPSRNCISFMIDWPGTETRPSAPQSPTGLSMDPSRLPSHYAHRLHVWACSPIVSGWPFRLPLSLQWADVRQLYRHRKLDEIPITYSWGRSAEVVTKSTTITRNLLPTATASRQTLQTSSNLLNQVFALRGTPFGRTLSWVGRLQFDQIGSTLSNSWPNLVDSEQKTAKFDHLRPDLVICWGGLFADLGPNLAASANTVLHIVALSWSNSGVFRHRLHRPPQERSLSEPCNLRILYGGVPKQIGTMQRRLVWPLRKDETHTHTHRSRSVLCCFLVGGL